MAGPIQLTETDFEQIKQNLVNYLKSTNKFTDFNFEASNLSVILNLIAYQAQLNAYSANMVANETFLSTAILRDNVVANARQLGYLPRSARSSMCHVTFTFDLKSGRDLEDVYPRGLPGTLELNPGMAFNVIGDISSSIFNTIDVHRASVDTEGVAIFRDIPVYEGTPVNIEFTYDESKYDQRFILENTDIDVTTVRVEVQEDSNVELNRFYHQAENLTEIDDTSRVYWIEEVKNGRYELTFGDGLFGKKLQNGAKIHVDYIISNGEESNGIRGENNFTFVGNLNDSFGNKIRVYPTINSVTETHGGSEIETINSIKFRAPKSYSSQNRCVTSEDYESIVRQIYPAVDDVYVYGGETLSPPQYGRVFVAIKPKSAETLNSNTKAFIKESMEKYRIASLDVRLTDPEILIIELDSMVYYDDKKTKLDTAGVISAVRNNLVSYADTQEVSRFGGMVKYSQIVGMIDDTTEAITRNVTYLRMRRDFNAVIDTAASYEICFENEVELDYHEPSVYSSGFYIQGSNQIHYFENVLPVVGETTTKVQLFYFDDRNEKIVTDTKFGTFDFVRGEIMIAFDNPITITSTVLSNEIIQVRGKPKDNGNAIEAKGNVYLNFDIAQSKIMATIDGGIEE